MYISLKPDQEQFIGQAIRAGLIEAADDVVAAGVEAIRQRMEARPDLKSALGAEDWSRELHEWIDSHATTTPLLPDEAIDRDSVYGTRGQ